MSAQGRHRFLILVSLCTAYLFFDSFVCYQLRRSPVYVENGANCDCASLEQTQQLDGSSGSRQQQPDSFLVTGRKQGDRLVVEMIQSFSRRSKELRRAVRAIRQTDVCGQHSVVVDLDRQSPGGRRSNQRTRRPRKHRGEAVTMETTTTTTTTSATTAITPGRRSRNRPQSSGGSRRNRGGRNREARQRARASRRERQQQQGRH